MNDKARFAGMAVNERLWEAGLMEQWDSAVKSRNRVRMIEVLNGVDLASPAEQISDTVLANPKRYGF